MRKLLVEKMRSSGRKPGLAVKTLLGLALGIVPLSISQANDDHGHGDKSAPIVATDKGLVEGFRAEGITEFLGIPYAAPPIGNLRWRPPVAHEPWKGVWKATAFGPTCAQITETGVFAGPANNNEDCLYLNIFTPALDPHGLKPHEKLPVMFWNHGGGSDDESNDYDGSKLALQGRTIVVTLNFRLNYFGFFAHPALDNEGHPFANYQLLDNFFALKWIKQNIANFGGDPNNITVFGQSGGAKNVAAYIVSPFASGLFNKAIAESGPINPISMPLSLAEQKGVAVAVAAGCGSGTGPDVAQCLRNIPAAQLEALAGNGVPDPTSPGADTGSSPNVVQAIQDGQIIPGAAIDLLSSGRFNHVPILSGSVENEGVWNMIPIEYYESPQAPITEAQFTSYVNSTYSGDAGPQGSPPLYPSGIVAQVLAQYPQGNYPSPELQFASLRTDSVNGCPGPYFDDILAGQVPLYVYEFRDQTAPFYFPPMPGFVSLAYHTGDIQYYFPLFHGHAGIVHELNKAQARLSDELVAAWTNFAWTGNPNGGGNFPWPRYTANSHVIFAENISPVGLSTETEAQYATQHHCAFWNSILVWKSTIN